MHQSMTEKKKKIFDTPEERDIRKGYKKATQLALINDNGKCKKINLILTCFQNAFQVPSVRNSLYLDTCLRCVADYVVMILGYIYCDPMEHNHIILFLVLPEMTLGVNDAVDSRKFLKTVFDK